MKIPECSEKEDTSLRIATVGDNVMAVYDNLDKAFPGGNTVNVDVYFVRLGGEASYVGAVGTDHYGQLILDALREKEVDISHVKVLPGKTAITHVELVNGERIFGDYDEGVLADFTLSDEDVDFLCQHDMVVTALWGKVENDLAKIKAKGIPVAFDAATRPEDPIVDTAISNVDYLFYSSDDGDTPELRENMKKLHSRGPKVVVVTLGEKGSIAYDGDKFTVCGIVPCDVVDTMGAGDSYIAGFLYGILSKKPIEECMQMGAANSSITIGYNGAW